MAKSHFYPLHLGTRVDVKGKQKLSFMDSYTIFAIFYTTHISQNIDIKVLFCSSKYFFQRLSYIWRFIYEKPTNINFQLCNINEQMNFVDLSPHLPSMYSI